MQQSPALKWLAVFCLAATAAGLLFSQRAREMVTGLSGSPIMRQHLAGRRVFMAQFPAAPTAKFDDYDGHANTAIQLTDRAWLATGFVAYDWQGSPRRDRWWCAFDPQTSGMLAHDVGPGREPSEEFSDAVEKLVGDRARRSATDLIEERWGWRK
jgi:hypothetical protein